MLSPPAGIDPSESRTAGSVQNMPIAALQGDRVGRLDQRAPRRISLALELQEIPLITLELRRLEQPCARDLRLGELEPAAVHEDLDLGGRRLLVHEVAAPSGRGPR